MLNRHDVDILLDCFLFKEEKQDRVKATEEIQSFVKTKDCSVVEYLRGEVIADADKSAQKLGILLGGRVTASCCDGDKSSLKVFSEGEIFGAASIFCEGDSNAFARIKAETGCKILFITREGVERLLCEKPEKALKYIRFLCGRVEFLNKRISTFTSNQATERLAKYILDNKGNGTCSGINFAALARTLDISRASLYRARRELEELKAVSINSKSITILSEEKLITVLDKTRWEK